MPKTRQQKEITVKEYTQKLKDAKGVVFATFERLKVKDVEALRKQCHQEGVEYMVVKKTLMKLGFKEAGIEADPKTFEKGVASVFGTTDEIAAAKLIGAFAKQHEGLQPIGGILENQYIDKSKVMALATLPSKTELLAKVVGSINAPVSGFVNVLAGNLRGLVGVLSAIKTTKS